MAKLKTGRHTSALKENRKTQKRTEANKIVKSNMNTLAKKVEQACAKKDAESAKQLLKEAFSAWDKAAKANIVHWKKAASKKAQLAKKVSKL
ncbi:MAG: 30S ribosomal protein S20 [bacterium]